MMSALLALDYWMLTLDLCALALVGWRESFPPER